MPPRETCQVRVPWGMRRVSVSTCTLRRLGEHTHMSVHAQMRAQPCATLGCHTLTLVCPKIRSRCPARGHVCSPPLHTWYTHPSSPALTQAPGFPMPDPPACLKAGTGFYFAFCPHYFPGSLILQLRSPESQLGPEGLGSCREIGASQVLSEDPLSCYPSEGSPHTEVAPSSGSPPVNPAECLLASRGSVCLHLVPCGTPGQAAAPGVFRSPSLLGAGLLLFKVHAATCYFCHLESWL